MKKTAEKKPLKNRIRFALVFRLLVASSIMSRATSPGQPICRETAIQEQMFFWQNVKNLPFHVRVPWRVGIVTVNIAYTLSSAPYNISTMPYRKIRKNVDLRLVYWKHRMSYFLRHSKHAKHNLANRQTFVLN